MTVSHKYHVVTSQGATQTDWTRAAGNSDSRVLASEVKILLSSSRVDLTSAGSRAVSGGSHLPMANFWGVVAGPARAPWCVA